MYDPAAPDQNQAPGSAARNCLRADTADLTRFVPKARLRRVDHYSRMALLAAGRAMEGLGEDLVPKERTGLIVATGYGALNATFSFLDSYMDKGDRLAAPTHFSGSVHNAAAAHISICYGITGPCLTVSQFDLSFASALMTAGTWLATGAADSVLMGTVDEWSEVTGYCLDTISLQTEKPVPAFGEGAAFFLISRDRGTSPAWGYFEGTSMERNKRLGDGSTEDRFIFSPAAALPCPEGSLKESLEKRDGLFYRFRGASPTDQGMDAVYAFQTAHDKGGRVCCLKQGQDGTLAEVTVTGRGQVTAS